MGWKERGGQSVNDGLWQAFFGRPLGLELEPSTGGDKWDFGMDMALSIACTWHWQTHTPKPLQNLFTPFLKDTWQPAMPQDALSRSGNNFAKPFPPSPSHTAAHVSAPVSRIGGVAIAVLGVVAMLGGGKMEGFQATCPLAGYTCPLYEKKIFDASFMQNVSKK